MNKIGVRTILYTDGMEPIVVLELSESIKNYLERYGEIILPVIESPILTTMCNVPNIYKPKTVIIRLERFIRKGQEHFFIFTKDDENALLLKSAFLPGQHKEVSSDRAKAFAEGFLEALTTFGIKY